MPPLTPHAIFELAARLDQPDAEAAADALEGWVRTATARDVLLLGIEARAAFTASPWAAAVSLREPIDPEDFARITHYSPLAVCCVLSTHRSGYVREPALRYLAEARKARVVPYLLLRTDDVVPALRELAESAVESRFQPPLAPVFVRSLRLVEMLRGRSRGGDRLVRRIDDFLAQPACLEALAQEEDDPVVRRAAFALRLRVEPIAHVLAAALDDADLRVRTWAARAAVSRATPKEAKRALLPRLEASRSAQARRLALRVHRELGSDDGPFESALFDPQAVVRLDARSELRSRHPERPFGLVRERALDLLRARDTAAAQLVGALGVLSDLGRADDGAVVARFVEDPRPRVRSEAQRTQGLLQSA